jgi:large subunit ribosomal protein L30
VSDKAQRTIRIKWVRSGIGFSYRQKHIVRSLGLKKLNQEVERPDTPQIRGLVAKIPHLVEIVVAPPQAASTLVPEYTIYPPVAAPSKPAESGPEGPGDETEKSQAELAPSPALFPAQDEESGEEAAGEAAAAQAASAPVEEAVGAEAAPGPAAETKPSESPAPQGEDSAKACEGASPKKKGRRKA